MPSTSPPTNKRIFQEPKSAASSPSRPIAAAAAAATTPKNLRRKRSAALTTTTAVVVICIACIIAIWYAIQRSTDPAVASLRQRRSENQKPFRVFGPEQQQQGSTPLLSIVSESNDDLISFQFFTFSEQRGFLAEFGTICQRSFRKYNNNQENILLKRFDNLPKEYATELWKYCYLYTGVGNVYWQSDNALPLLTWEDLLLQTNKPTSNIAIKMEGMKNNDDYYDSFVEWSSSSDNNRDSSNLRLHHSFLQLGGGSSSNHRSKVTVNMMRHLTESRQLDSVRLSELLGMYVTNDKQDWTFFSARCWWKGDDFAASNFSRDAAVSSLSSIVIRSASNPRGATAGQQQKQQQQQCPVRNGGYCCQVWRPEDHDSWSSMVLRDPYLVPNALLPSPTTARSPFRETRDEQKLAMPVDDLPFIATVRQVPTQSSPLENYQTPNFFDILAENSCLPESKECFRCLKTTDKDKLEQGDCQRCHKQCPCYCSALCKIRPPPKQVAAEWFVRPPLYRKAPNRLVPRIIHQTWYEPITKEKYPNMSRLIESFQQSGWEYYFYDDAKAAQFLSTHFPPQVREAYDAMNPGAFKADLFRYCVLLIRGGVYADMDVILESNLDHIIDDSVGFLTAQDEPGLSVNARSCLWNGFLAAAPGHPFLMRTIENVVNNIRNRFTSVDYDDMLCPDPVLSVSHTTDMLFTCGPCILGASINDVLKRHRQTTFEYGDIDLFETERKQDETGTIVVDSNDIRLSIPGRSILLKQDKDDMGAHRFTYDEANIVVASTDLPEYDDRPKSLVHYSKTHEKSGIYGLTKLYANSTRANEVIQIRVDASL